MSLRPELLAILIAMPDLGLELRDSARRLLGVLFPMIPMIGHTSRGALVDVHHSG